MPRWEPVHPKYARALDRLARRDVSYAEALRLLIPPAQELGLPRPSYWLVRRYLIDARRRLELAHEEREQFNERVVAPLLAGRIPRV